MTGIAHAIAFAGARAARLGGPWLALLATLLTFAVLFVLAWLERRVGKRGDDG